MTKTPDQDAYTAAMSPEVRIPVQAPIPPMHTENTGEQDTLDLQTGDQDAGDIPPGPASGDPPPEAHARPREEPLKVTVKRRLEAEGRWADRIELERNDMMKAARKQGMSKVETQAWVYSELERMYPPLENRKISGSEDDGQDTEKRKFSGAQRPVDDGQIQGLAAIPESWPELPANASLSSEIGWVQANRLRIVEEKPGRATVVLLDRVGQLSAGSKPASRSYAKYVDVAAKTTASDDGESEVWMHERMAIEEVRALLDEMRESEGD